MNQSHETFRIYQDMKNRTNGELYIGVVGPVRTGKSTFIRRFMEEMIIPDIKDENLKKKTIDELPQAGSGNTIMTTEPKFIPSDAMDVKEIFGIQARIRLIDCVGYMVDGALGGTENDAERMVKTPWFDYEIPFSKAAHIGTSKVISEHASVGIVMTTDGSIGTLSRSPYIPAEEQIINELHALHKPFVIVVNSTKPDAPSCMQLVKELEEKYKHHVLAVNCSSMQKKDVEQIFQKLLEEFPITKILAFAPDWVNMLSNDHEIKKEMIACIRTLLESAQSLHQLFSVIQAPQEKHFIQSVRIRQTDLSDGTVEVFLDIDKQFYFQELSRLTKESLTSDYDIIRILREYADTKEQYRRFLGAMNQVEQCGYGIVEPLQEEIKLEEPKVFKNGGRYGVKISANAQTIHFIKTSVCTEISPVVGDEKQANDLIEYMTKQAKDEEGDIWNVEIFGKTIEQIVEEGIHEKLTNLSDDTRKKLCEAMQKITNDTNKRLFFFLL